MHITLNASHGCHVHVAHLLLLSAATQQLKCSWGKNSASGGAGAAGGRNNAMRAGAGSNYSNVAAAAAAATANPLMMGMPAPQLMMPSHQLMTMGGNTLMMSPGSPVHSMQHVQHGGMPMMMVPVHAGAAGIAGGARGALGRTMTGGQLLDAATAANAAYYASGAANTSAAARMYYGPQ